MLQRRGILAAGCQGFSPMRGRADFTRRESRGVYDNHVIGLGGGPVCAESGVRFVPDRPLSDAPPLDTIIVPGGSGLREASTNSTVSAWLRLRARAIGRSAGHQSISAVCCSVSRDIRMRRKPDPL